MKEIYLCSLLKDDEIRKLLSSRLKIWMFDEDIPRTVYSILQNTKKFNEAAFTADLSAHLNPAEMTTILDMMREVRTPLLGEDRDLAVERLITFAREQSLAKAIHKARTEGISESVWEDFRKADSLGVHEDQMLDFTNPEHRKKAHDKMFPHGIDNSRVIKSSFSLINNHSTMGGYTPGTVNMFVARPGLGKTTCLLNESVAAALQGYKVLHILLGDMQEFDVLVKYMACYHQEEINKIVLDYEQYATPEIDRVFDNVRTTCHGAYELDVQSLISLCKSTKRDFDYDMIIIDYDGNIRINEENMYMSWGYTYGQLEKLSKDLGVPILIGCQAKVIFWTEEILPLESASESSKKQHVIDMMVTLGNSHKKTRVGTMHLAKMRRGEDNVTMRILYGNKKGKILEISEEMYQQEINKMESLEA